MKRFISIILAAALTATLSVTAFAYGPIEYTSAEGEGLPEADVSDGVLAEGGVLSDGAEYLEEWHDGTPLTFDVSYDGADLSWITDSSGQYNGYDVMWADDAAAYCIELMRQHVEKTGGNFLVAVPYSVSELGSSSPYTYAFNVYSDEFADAFNDSLYVTGGGGDYLLYSMYGRPFYVTSSCKYFTSGDDGIALVWATPGSATYYTSASQEEEFARQAQDVVSTLKKQVGDGATDYEKTCAVYDWIVKNVEYDYDNLGTGDYYIMYTAYGALVDGKAVCQGYANLFYYLLNELGVPCRIVAGTGYTGSASGPHAWNIVKLDGTWYHVDSTWGASYARWYSGRYFFLQSEANFVNGTNGTGHEMDYMTGIMYIDYTSDEFLSAHPISPTADYCGHSYVLAKSRAAACGVYGYEVYVCSKCGETYEETFDRLDHDWVTVTEASCDGTGLVRCLNCGEEEPVGPAGHDYQYVKTTEPTCTEDGYDLYACSVCGHEHETGFTDSLGGHEYGEVITEDATHTEDGYERFTCVACGHTYTVTIPKVAYHVYGGGYEAAEFSATCGYDYTAECDICHKTEYALSPLHDFEEIEGHEGYLSCAYCGIVVAEETDADGNGTGEHEVFLDEDGAPYHADAEADAGTCGHEYVTVPEAEATCLHPGHAELSRCACCGLIEDAEEDMFTEPSGHSWDERGEDATCTDDGYRESYCSSCGEVLTSSVEAVPAAGHHPVTAEGYAATCTASGMTDGTYCSSCGETLQEAETVPAAGHDLTETGAVTPTCTEGGRTEGWYCSSCGEVFEESIELPANGHAWRTVSREVSATCTDDGQEALVVCSVCGETDPDANGSVIPAGHVLTRMEHKEPTEYEDGNIECWYCYGCDTFFLDADATEEISFAGTVLTWDGGSPAAAAGTAAEDGNGPESSDDAEGDTEDALQGTVTVSGGPDAEDSVAGGADGTATGASSLWPMIVAGMAALAAALALITMRRRRNVYDI